MECQRTEWIADHAAVQSNEWKYELKIIIMINVLMTEIKHFTFILIENRNRRVLLILLCWYVGRKYEQKSLTYVTYAGRNFR